MSGSPIGYGTRMAARARAVVAVACFVQFVDVVGVTLLIVALPAIQRDLGLGAPALSWAAAVYALVFGSLLVLGGRAADLAGRRVIAVPDGPGRGRAFGWWTLAGAGWRSRPC
jgi:MFS family permease